MARLTDERIAEIERLSTMATNYLWGVDERDGSVYANVYGELVVPLVELDNPISASRDIVETIRAIPDLLAEVKALRGQNEWLEKIRWMHNEDAQFMLDEISRVSKEVKALKAERDAALQQNAITILDSVSDIINGLSAGIAGDSGKKHFQLGINCPYCGSHFDNVKEAKEHDGMCEAHPAVIRAKKTEAERDVLAMRLAYDEDSPLACPERPCGMGWAPKEECFDCWLKYAKQQTEKQGEQE